MVAADVGGAGEIGNGAGDFEDAVVGAGAQIQIGHGEFQQLDGGLVQRAMSLDFLGPHAGVAGDGRFVGEAGLLELAGLDDAGANGGGSFAGPLAADFAKFDLGHLDVQINAVEQRAGDAAEIVLDFAGRTAGFARHFAVGGGIHGGDQHKLGRESDGAGGAGNGDVAFLDGLAHGFEDAALEFGQFIQEEDAVMGAGNLSGGGIGGAAEQAGVAGRMVGSAKGTAGDEGLAGFEQAHDAVDFGCLKRFFEGQRRQNGGEAFGEHGFTGARRTDEEDVVAAGGGDFQGAFDG